MDGVAMLSPNVGNKTNLAEEFLTAMRRAVLASGNQQGNMGAGVLYQEKYMLEYIYFCPRLMSNLGLPEKALVLQGAPKPNKAKHSSSRTSDSFSSGLGSESESDFTGCPLECTFEMNGTHNGSITGPETTFNEASSGPHAKKKYSPLPSEEARTLLSLYTQAVSKKEPLMSKTPPPLLILCDGSDSQYTTLMGMYKKQGSSTRFVATCRGPITAKEDLPTLIVLQKRHLWGFSRTLVHTDTDAFAQYCIVNFPVNPSGQESKKSSSLLLECRWNRVTSILQPPLSEGMCSLLIKVVPGDERSSSYSLYKELKVLQGLSTALRTCEVTWSPNSTGQSCVQKVKAFLEALKEGNLRRKAERHDLPWDSSDLDRCLETAVMGKRHNTDFTDQLWSVIKGCASYQELRECLFAVFSALRTKEIQPFVHRKNGTTLGKLVRSINHDGVHFPPLVGLTPLQLLVELGVQKLQRDYMAVIIGLELATQDQLSPFICSCINAQEALRELLKLHCVVEMMVMCTTYLHLPKQILSTYVREALKYFNTIDDLDPSHVFTFPLQMSHVRTYLDGLKPSIWHVAFTTAEERYRSYTMCQLAQRPPFEHVSNQVNDTCYREFNYYCTVVTCIRDIFG